MDGKLRSVEGFSKRRGIELKSAKKKLPEPGRFRQPRL